MATTLELIKELHDKRQGLISQMREFHAKIESGTDDDGQAQESIERYNSEISELGTRIDNLITMTENEKAAAEQRERFAGLISPNEEKAISENFEEKVRTWLMAGLPDAEVWAPRAIEVKLGKVGVSMADRQALMGAPERHDLTKGTATDGAELIPTGFVRTLYEHLIEFAGVRQTNAQVFRTSAGEALLVPATTTHGVATLVAEAGPFLENDPQFKQVSLGAYKYGQLIQVSRELVEDSAVDLLGYLARAAGIAIGTANGAHLVTGNGTGQPQGIADTPTAGVTGATGTTLTVTGASLISLYHSIISGYRRSAYWVMNDATAAAIRLIRDDTGGAGLGNFLWNPGLQAGQPDTLLGRPVVTDPTMPVMAANAYSIAFGDFSSFYAIRDVDSVRFERSDDFAFANDLVTFRSVLRTDGKQLINGANGAVKFYRNSAT